MIKSVLFLCIGNICRSPMAEGLLRQAMPQLAVCSAGIDALVGQPADPHSIRLMEERGIDISAHRAQSLAAWMLKEADLILTMDSAQAHYIGQRFPAVRAKVARLGAAGNFDIPDPYRRGLAAFQHSGSLIVQGVEQIVRQLEEHGLAESAPSPAQGSGQPATISCLF